MAPTGGGVEVWLMHMLRHIDREQFRMDFLVHTPQPKAFDDEIRALGSRVIPCVRPLHLYRYPFAFRRAVAANGPYDVLHCHVLFSGLVMRLARSRGVPVRVAHSHSDAGGFGVDGEFFRGRFITWTNRWARHDATHGLACSRRAAAALFGPDHAADPRFRLFYYGVDLTPFEAAVDSARLRAELGIPPGVLVIGHVGRFQEQKNHTFLIDVAAAVARRQETRLLLVGDGPLRPAVERMVADLGLGDRVVFAGVRRDVARLMRGVMDVFVLPSHYEGLPLVGIEAQAAGLPLVLSDTITDEVDVIPELIQRRSLKEQPEAWAGAVLAAQPRRADALARMRQSPFDLGRAVRNLEEFYRACTS
jgi:glycosyltransferase involved in cell wall biosynthesis